MALTTPDLVVVGHVCRDVTPEPPGWRPGGAVFYAASTAARLGYSVGVLTAGASPTVEEGTASAMTMKSTNGPEMFLYEDENNGLMGTSTNSPFGLRSNNIPRLWVASDGRVSIGSPFNFANHLLELYTQPKAVCTRM